MHSGRGWGCRVGEARTGITSPMPDHNVFKLQQLVNFQKFSTLRIKSPHIFSPFHPLSLASPPNVYPWPVILCPPLMSECCSVLIGQFNVTSEKTREIAGRQKGCLVYYTYSEESSPTCTLSSITFYLLNVVL